MLSTVNRSNLSNWSKTHTIHTHTLTHTDRESFNQTMLKETANSCLSSNIVGEEEVVGEEEEEKEVVEEVE